MVLDKIWNSLSVCFVFKIFLDILFGFLLDWKEGFVDY